MKKLRNLSLTRRSICFGILAVFLGTCVAQTTLAWYKKISQSQKKIEQFRGINPEPLELVEIRDKDKPLTLSKSFKREGEWLKGTEFKLKNVFTKDIIYIEFYLNFPETTASGNEMAYPLKFGKSPETNEVQEVPTLKPNEELTFKVDENTFDRLSQFIGRRHPLASLTLLRVDLGFIVFSDHTAWQGGNYYVQDPANPRHFINVGDSLPNK